MQAVKAIYKEGNVHLLTPIVGVNEAELFVIVLDKNTQSDGIAQSFRVMNSDAEQDFQTIGMNHFFDTDNDSNVDWEDVFNVAPR
jgi:predicted extracellular nuclease